MRNKETTRPSAMALMLCLLAVLVFLPAHTTIEAAALNATMGGTYPNLGLFLPGQTVPLNFTAIGAAGQTLNLTIYDVHDKVVLTTQYTVASSSWNQVISAYNSYLGFYRVTAQLSDGTLATPVFASSVPSSLTAYKGPLPGYYLTYAIVPDPAGRLSSLSEDESFFGLQGGFSSKAGTDILALLGVRWSLDAAWAWKYIAPTATQRNVFVANPSVSIPWATNGSGGNWTVYTIPSLTKDGRPYAGNPDVYLSGTFAYNTGALNPNYSGDWLNYTAHVAQNWPQVYPSRKQRYYEVTWEPIPTWGYGGNATQLVTLYQLAAQSIRSVDSTAQLVGPCMDIDAKGSLQASFNDFDAGLGPYIDVFSAHPYMENDAGWDAGFYEPELSGQPALIATMKRRLRAYKGGIDIPLIGTEQGWRTRQTQSMEINQARRMIRANLILLGEGWKINTAFYMADYPSTDNWNSAKNWEWGIFYNLDPGTNGGYGPNKVMPKPVVPAYAAMTFLVEGRKSVANVNWLGDTTRGYVYESYANSTDEVLVLWDFSSQRSVIINTGVASVDVYDWMGNKQTRQTTQGVLNVTLSNEPVYIKGVSGALWGSQRAIRNVAVNKSVTTSASLNSTTVGSLAVDDDVWSYESRWVTPNDTSAKWLLVDLGQEYSVVGVRFFTGDYVPGPYGSNKNPYKPSFSSYRLQTWNGSVWQDLVVRTNNTKAAVDEDFTSSPVSTSKVRLYLDASPTVPTQAMVYEFQVLANVSTTL